MPPREKIEEHVSKLYHEIGPQHLTMKVLRKRLEADFEGVSFVDHKALLEEIVLNVMKTPTGQKAIARAEKAKIEGAVSAGKGKKRQEKREDRDDKPAKQAKKEKIEGEPKKPASGFMRFSNEKRAAVMSEMKTDPDAKVDLPAVGKKLGEMWNALSDEEKAPYNAQYAESKVKYAEEKGVFDATHPGKSSGKAAAAKAAAPAGPKRPNNAFFCFSNAKRAEVVASGVKGIADVGRKIGEMWKQCTDKKQWDDEAMADYQRYVRECNEMGVEVKAKPPKPAAEAGDDAAAAAAETEA